MFSNLSLGVVLEIKSREMIKPSSPTPNQRKAFKLSLLDQLLPHVYMPFIFFYQTPLSNSNECPQRSMVLKRSLSETLTHFYPFAGRLEGNLINCNDQGVDYYEAHVAANLSQVIQNPNPNELTKLLPLSPVPNNKRVIAGVQVNHFSCGSVAISVSISHKISDGATTSAFVNAWAAKARGFAANEDDFPQARFHAASIFPPIIEQSCIKSLDSWISKEKIVTRRLVFDKEKLEALKKQSTDASTVKAPMSSVAVVCALIWKKFIEAKPTPRHPKFFTAVQLVNLRSLPSPPVPDNCYGNLIGFAFANASVEEEEEGVKYAKLVSKVRVAVKDARIDESYSDKIKTGECYQEYKMAIDNSINGVADVCTFSDCTRFPMYDADFGWGKPVWVSMATVPSKNMVFLLGTRCGQGIEAWVNVLETDASMLDDQDSDFLSVTLPRVRGRL